MANYRFIHAADLHLDSQFGVLSAEFPELAQIFRTSTFEAYDRIIDLCIEEKVDALRIRALKSAGHQIFRVSRQSRPA